MYCKKAFHHIVCFRIFFSTFRFFIVFCLFDFHSVFTTYSGYNCGKFVVFQADILWFFRFPRFFLTFWLLISQIFDLFTVGLQGFWLWQSWQKSKSPSVNKIKCLKDQMSKRSNVQKTKGPKDQMSKRSNVQKYKCLKGQKSWAQMSIKSKVKKIKNLKAKGQKGQKSTRPHI